MKKITTLTAGILLGMNIALAGGNIPGVQAEEAHSITAVESKDNTIFKVAQLRPDYIMGEYRLAKYDVINIMALGLTEDIGENDITVGVDGMAALPYVGNVKLAGLTVDEARAAILTKLGQYYKLPELSISIKRYGARKIYVMGNVNNPGIKEMNVDNMNVYAAVSSAGGVDKRGRSKHIQLIRQQDGVLYYREINIDAFVKKHDLSQNIQLEDGDIVYVPDSGKVIFSEDVAPYINIWATYRALTKD